MNGTVWVGWEEANMHFNETQVSGWITQPANTWTNLAYLVVGVIIFFIVRSTGKRNYLMLIPISAILVGITSCTTLLRPFSFRCSIFHRCSCFHHFLFPEIL
jgi:hypothetical protein